MLKEGSGGSWFGDRRSFTRAAHEPVSDHEDDRRDDNQHLGDSTDASVSKRNHYRQSIKVAELCFGSLDG